MIYTDLTLIFAHEAANIQVFDLYMETLSLTYLWKCCRLSPIEKSVTDAIELPLTEIYGLSISIQYGKKLMDTEKYMDRLSNIFSRIP